MARLFYTGWETGDTTGSADGVAEGSSGADASATIVSTTPHGGSFCLSCTTASALTASQSFSLGTGALARDYFVRLYIRKSANPANAVGVLSIISTSLTNVASVRLNTDGTLNLLAADGTTVIGSASAALGNAQWYRIEMLVQVNAATTGHTELRVDGATVSGTSTTNSNLGTVAPGTVSVGWGTAATSTATILLDDLAVNDNQGTAQNTWCGDGRIVHLWPTADSAVGAGWTLGTGTATGGNAFAALDNIPPVGVADLAVGSDPKQIRNASANANSAYNPTMTTYTAAGLASSDVIQVLQAVCITAAPSATSAKSGSMRILSNPVDAGLVSFGTFYNGASIAGTYSSGWMVRSGTIYDQSNANVAALTSANYGTAPTMSINQVTSSTRIAMVCLAYMRVEFQAAPAATPSMPWQPAPSSIYLR